MGAVLLALLPEQVAASILTAAFIAGLISEPSLYRISVDGNLAWGGDGLLERGSILLGGGDGDGDLIADLLLLAVTAGTSCDLAASGLGLTSSCPRPISSGGDGGNTAKLADGGLRIPLGGAWKIKTNYEKVSKS